MPFSPHQPVSPQTNSRPISSSHDRRSNRNVGRANAILQGKAKPGPDELRSLVIALKNARYFDLGRQIAAYGRRLSAKGTDGAAWLAQQQALCTYKDPDLPADQRLDDALSILRTELEL